MTRQPAQCGTPAGWHRHYRCSEKPCEPCRLAKNADIRARKATIEMPPCAYCGGPRRACSGAHGWCNNCTMRWHRAGRPDTGPPPSYAMQCEDYDWLREQGHLPVDAAERLGISLSAAARHEKRRANAGLPTAPVPPTVYMKTCTACGKYRKHRGRGWCAACYLRWYHAGKPDTGPPPLDADARNRAHSERATARHGLNAAIQDAGWEWAV